MASLTVVNFLVHNYEFLHVVLIRLTPLGETTCVFLLLLFPIWRKEFHGHAAAEY